MKKFILILITTFSLSCCNKDEDKTTIFQLPPETMVGANTFGCIINGQVFYPRDGTSTLFNPGGKGLKFWGDPSMPNVMGNYNELEIRNLQDAKPANSMIIHLQGLDQIKTGDYVWHDSNFQSSIDGLMQNYVYAKIYNSSVNGWQYYGSYENSGKITIKRYDFTNRIVSGTFSGKLRLMNSTTELEIQSGRFDIKWSTLDTTPFP
jgi:hypothetical protein